MTIDDQSKDLGSLTQEFEKIKKRIVVDMNRLHVLAQEIDRKAVADGNGMVSLVARGAIRTFAAMGRGVSQMRSLKTAERKETAQREEEASQLAVKEAAAEMLKARRAARQEQIVASQPSVASYVGGLGRGYGGRTS